MSSALIARSTSVQPTYDHVRNRTRETLVRYGTATAAEVLAFDAGRVPSVLDALEDLATSGDSVHVDALDCLALVAPERALTVARADLRGNESTRRHALVVLDHLVHSVQDKRTLFNEVLLSVSSYPFLRRESARLLVDLLGDQASAGVVQFVRGEVPEVRFNTRIEAIDVLRGLSELQPVAARAAVDDLARSDDRLIRLEARGLDAVVPRQSRSPPP